MAALAMAKALPPRHKSLGADKGYDARDFVMELRELGIIPHVAQNAYETETARRRSAIDGRTTRHDGYALSQKKRKRIEEILAGSRLSAACATPSSAASIGSVWRLLSPLPLTTSSASRSSWQKPRDRSHRMAPDGKACPFHHP